MHKTHKISLQHGKNYDAVKVFEPSRSKIQRWINVGVQDLSYSTEVCLRIVGKQEIQTLNNTYRKKDKPTNVLSFPSELPEIIPQETRYLGDIILCAEVIREEADDQKKSLDAHWAHMVLHGLLHLRGYDHIEDHEAVIMETFEIKLLEQLGFSNPYENSTYE